MVKNQVTINQLAAEMLQELKRVGYTDFAIYRDYYPKMQSIIKYYTTAGITYYSVAATNEFITWQEERIKRGEISKQSLHSLRHVAVRMNEYFITQTLRICAKKHGTIYVISPGNENLIDRFLAVKQYKENTSDDVRWVVRKYLYYMEQKGYASMAEVSIEDVRTFILDTAMKVKASSLHNILLYLKYFHMFLKEEGVQAPDCVELFSYKVYRDMPIQSYVTDEEFNRIINVIDRSTDAGKRDYAIIQLAASTGLRACDIIRLRLTDIDWRKGAINIVQKKTDKKISLPLFTDAANAIQDYILNARPASDSNEVFLRIMPPFIGIVDASCIGDMFKRYQRKAGINRQALDGKGFHGLRRRLAKKLLVSGTPSTTIAQILGHSDVSSVRQYLSLDTSNIKECALSFSGIEFDGKGLKR